MGNNLASAHNRQSAEIDAALRRDANRQAQMIKLLLLGSAECGKSTILKQMRILHAEGFSETEYEMQRPNVYFNIISGINTIIDEMPRLGLCFEDPQRKVDAEIVTVLPQCSEAHSMTPELASTIKRLWLDSGVQAAFQRANEYQLSDSVKYFLDEIDRIGCNYYRPTLQDLLRLRIATTGIVEIAFQLKGATFR